MEHKNQIGKDTFMVKLLDKSNNFYLEQISLLKYDSSKILYLIIPKHIIVINYISISFELTDF